MEEYLDVEGDDEEPYVSDRSSSSSSSNLKPLPSIGKKRPIIISDDERAPPPPPSSGEDNCPICLQPFETETFVDGCYHRFCLTCILQWTEIAPSCPLCKAPIRELIHDVTDDLQYRKINIAKFKKSKSASDTFPTSIHRKRKRIYNLNLRGTVPLKKPSFILGPKTITEKLWESRLKPWIEREAQSILEEEDVSLLVTVLKGLLFRYAPQTPEVKKELEGFFGAKDTQTFLHELSIFASAQCDVKKFDEIVEYVPASFSSSAPSSQSPSQRRRPSTGTPAPAAPRSAEVVDLTKESNQRV